jgi:hypothetical protein
MKLIFTIFLSFFASSSFCQNLENSISIKEIINCYEKGSIHQTQTFILSKKFHLLDGSFEEANTYTIVYKRFFGESIGLRIQDGKIDMIMYLVSNQQVFDQIKSELNDLGFKTGKPYQNENEGIIEEMSYEKNRILVISSKRVNSKHNTM